MSSVDKELDEIFGRAGASGRLHAVNIDSGEEVAYHADTASVTASVFKMFVLLETLFQASEGKQDFYERVRIDGPRTLGPTGLSVMQDPVELSVRDLIYLMMAISDNHATDVLCARVGIPEINARLRSLGLTTSRVVGDCRHMFEMMKEDYGVSDLADVDRDPAAFAERIRACRAMDPDHANRSTPRELTMLMRAIWRNEIGTREICGGFRLAMSAQFGSNRFAIAFPDPFARIWSKPGTLPHIRAEAGVVQFRDGRRYAVAVMTRLEQSFLRQPDADEAIGRAAAAAVRAIGGP
jgi:beta-lactamase class A